MIRLSLILAATLFVLTPNSGLGQKIITRAKLQPAKAKSATVIEGCCAVIVRPDDKKLVQMKRAGSREDYDVSVNENEYYIGTSVAFLNSAKVRQIYRQAYGILVFKSSSGRYFKIPLTDVYWGIILFNGRTKPIDADVTNIEADYRAYMKK